MNILDVVLNWIIFRPNSMKKLIFKTYRTGLHSEESNGTKRINNFNDNSNDPKLTRENVWYLPPHLNPFDFDSPRFRGLVQGNLEPRTIWGLSLEIQNLKTFIFTTFIFATFKNFLQKICYSSLLQEPACHARCSPSLTRCRPDFLFPKHSWIVGQHYDGFQTN